MLAEAVDMKESGKGRFDSAPVTQAQKELYQMVCKVSRTEVSVDDFLTDNVYYYNWEKHPECVCRSRVIKTTYSD